MSPDEYELSVVFDRTQKRFELALLSRSARPICLHAHDWPNTRGQLHSAAESVYVQVGDSRCHASDRDLGTCRGPNCTLRIGPGGALGGFIALSEFECAVDVKGTPQLSFPVAPTHCR